MGPILNPIRCRPAWLAAAVILAGSGPAAGGGVEVLGSAASFGRYGLRIEVAPTCSVDDVLVPPGPINTNYVACRTITAGQVEIVPPGAAFVAGDAIIIENAFSVAAGVPFVANASELVNSPFAYVRNDKPSAEQIYTASFHLRLDLLTLADGDEIDHFAGYSADGELQFKLLLRRNGILDENRLAIIAREDGGSLVEHPSEFLLSDGYNVIRMSWSSGAGDGTLVAAVGTGTPLSGLTDLNNSLARIDYVQWGAIGGTLSTTQGFLELDEFSTVVEIPGENDCVPYIPTETGEGFSGEWSEANEEDEHFFTVPGDPGGGYATVTLSTEAPVVPWLTVTHAAHTFGAISAGSAAVTQDEQKIISVFEVAPGQTYKLVAKEFDNAPEHPWPYDLGWSFNSRVDCYEPNDAYANQWPTPVAAARAIPVGTVVEAYSIAGHLTNFIGNAVNTHDWYRFTLTNTETVTIKMLDVPSDQVGAVKLWSETGIETASHLLPESGEPFEIGPTLLGPGDWYIDVHWWDRGRGEVRPLLGHEIPDHFDTPYQLQVVMDPDQHFVNGFESGDLSGWDSHAP